MLLLVDAQNIKKSFKEVQALDGVSLQVSPGEFVALLGPNGAGKTTLVEIIEGIQFPDSGTVSIKGMNWKEHREKIHRVIGLSLQETYFFERITVLETLNLFASFFGESKERANAVLNQVGLQEKSKAFTMHLSGGQKQKLALAVALIHRPELLLLDEPTTGLDPSARRELWNQLMALKKDTGTSMILTTHYMEEAQFLCDRVIILNKGRIIKEGTPQNLLRESGEKNLDALFIALTGRSLVDENPASLN